MPEGRNLSRQRDSRDFARLLALQGWAKRSRPQGGCSLIDKKVLPMGASLIGRAVGWQGALAADLQEAKGAADSLKGFRGYGFCPFASLCKHPVELTAIIHQLVIASLNRFEALNSSLRQ